MTVELPTQSCRSAETRLRQYTSLAALPSAILINAWQGWHIQQARREADDLVLAVYTR